MSERQLQITVIHTPARCKKCIATEEVVQEVAAQFEGRVQVNILCSDAPEADKFGVVLSPAVFVDDILVATGVVPTKERLAQVVAQQLGL